ncbi:TMV resistance protein N-like [Ipomoea triloba]|uniref:TMV resistance protein N-like n=1 Tax=Ipomoea triloba TaxID=35885 RepID=UPI00125E7C60|nr:TMV resistance protein N-like [Ipomoea triloba]
MASSSSSRSHSEFSVFLSFRGETRTSFSDHLYTSLLESGVSTFRDEEGIWKGDNISDALKQAIEASEMSIVVFSKNYAQSRWCLNELVKMVECKQKFGQKILPIFYHVTPSEVRKQTGEFGIALNQHIEQFGEETVNEWKTALTTVADFSGWHIMEDGYESWFIKRITECVLRELNHTYMNVAKYPVGIDSPVKDIENLLQSQTNDGVKMIGIFGTGGVGKTTLAKAIYNRNYLRFEGSSFIANVRSEASRGRLACLQEKLVCETLKRKIHEIDDVDRGITLIKRILTSKKVLIVLDDIDHRNQLNSLAGQRDWFGSGSIIMITTRDVQLLSNLRAHEKYEVNMLNFNESLQLLSWHAFGVPVPLEEYSELSKTIASYTKGLPLALEVVGSHLHGRSVQEWRDDAEKLKKIPHGEVQEILKISYDALDYDTQYIFLDIACFFIGDDKNNTVKILKACDFFPGSGIRTLTDRCLLTINKDDKFEMHDLVRDMGREIVRMESPQDPGKRSRLVDPKDVIDVLQGKKGTNAIEGMIVNSDMLTDVSFNTKAFKRMKNLRILILDGVCLIGSLEYLSHELRLLRLRNCHLSCISSEFFFGKLVELDMSHSNIKEFQLNMQHLTCLKILKLDGCKLKKTPHFTGAHSLEKLSFHSCSKLVKVHQSIGSLKGLLELDFSSCSALKVLPSSICELKSVKVLHLESCQKLKELPTNLGDLEELKHLQARGTAISNIPFSLGRLRNLEILELGVGFVPLTRTRGPARFLPPSVGDLCKLQRLSTRNINLGEIDLPNDLGRLTSLSDLDLSGCLYLRKLPFSPGHLSNLKNLCLGDCKDLRVLEELPPNLEELSAGNCVSLEKIADISTCKRLRRLYIPNCKNLAELPGLETLESLETLEIRNCSGLNPPIENWFQARCEGDSFKICLLGWGVNNIKYIFPTLLGRKFLRTSTPRICSRPYGVRVSIRSRTTGAWIEEGGEYIRFRFNEFKRIHFEVPTIIGEVLEVYAQFNPTEILSIFDIHRNEDGEVRFFPSTRGFQQAEPTPHRLKRHKLLPTQDLPDSVLRGFKSG